ncbi:MAG: CcmD family protein [Caldilineaceae bacterium]|nr:CcmD family protein [Caldilineaceae bacterium]MCB0188598.1 CcmD family protein [Caldilineaceae bacterium]HRW05940.1 CcmD family protein [Caldilineaceae bacterium]
MGFLTAAFMGIWALVLVYVIYLGQRQSSLEQELRSLEEVMNERNRSA